MRMAAQVPDQFRYLGQTYEIVAVERNDVFQPEIHGFQPIMLNTACWRGYYSRYAILRDRLVLATLSIGLDPKSPPPVWLGVVPRKERHFRADWAWEYPDVNLPLSYTGGVLIGRTLIREFQIDEGAIRPYGYRHIIELTFRDGRPIHVTDHSETMRAVRESIREIGLAPQKEHIELLFAKAFSHTRETKWFL